MCVSIFTACNGSSSQRSVVVYTSVDQHYAEPILKAFEAHSGIRVKAVYDVEAAKTTGLVNRIIAEKQRPQADVFWNGEFVQTLLLKAKGLLAPYASPNAAQIPAQYRDGASQWTGFGGRARVLIVNTDLLPLEAAPKSLFELLDPAWPAQKIGVAYPLFGTSATHAAALYAHLGPQKGGNFFKDLKDRGVRVVDGNAMVRDQVAAGQLVMGLTDTDDACGAVQRGAPVAIRVLDQEANGMGTLIVPNTVALMAGAPNAEQGKALIDHLLRPETEEKLIRSGWLHVSLRLELVSSDCMTHSSIRAMSVSLASIYQQLKTSKEDLRSIFIR